MRRLFERLGERLLLTVDVSASLLQPGPVLGDAIVLEVEVRNSGCEVADAVSLSGEFPLTVVRWNRMVEHPIDHAESERVLDVVGSATGVGDVNGDGIGDFASANSSATVNGVDRAGTVELMLGGDEFRRGFTLEGFRLNGRLGREVTAAGDLNGDGFDDVIVTGSRSDDVAQFVVFGSNFEDHPVFSADELDGENGFVLPGAVLATAGDINGDGFSDIVFSQISTDEERSGLYVLFGHEGIGGSGELSVEEGEGFQRLISGDPRGIAILNLSAGGDINGDGFSDIAIGSTANGGRRFIAHVLYGGDLSSLLSDEDLASLNGANGFSISGTLSGAVKIVPDVNSDGVDDLLIGDFCHGFDPVWGCPGSAFLFLGEANLGASGTVAVESASVTILDSTERSGELGTSVGSAGDFNGDGIGDIVLGAPLAVGLHGAAYVVFGQEDWQASLDLSTLEGTRGFSARRPDPDFIAGGEMFGNEVSWAGDVNRDGLDDVIASGRIILGHMTNSGTGIFNDVLSIQPGETVRYRISGQIPDDAQGSLVLAVTATVEGDDDPANNSASLTIDWEPPLVEGDVNVDGVVNVEDFLVLSRNFGRVDVSREDGDLNEDGFVDVRDFLVLSRSYGLSAKLVDRAFRE